MRTSCKRARIFVAFLFLLPLLLLAVGCGGKEGSVSGKVTYKGEALKSGTVAFYPEGKGGSFTGGIKPDGSYLITKVPPGAAKITVVTGSTKAPTAGEMKQMGRGAQAAQKGMENAKSRLKENAPPGAPVGSSSSEPAVAVPEKYNDPEKSGLTVTVTGGKQTHDIKIE